MSQVHDHPKETPANHGAPNGLLKLQECVHGGIQWKRPWAPMRGPIAMAPPVSHVYDHRNSDQSLQNFMSTWLIFWKHGTFFRWSYTCDIFLGVASIRPSKKGSIFPKMLIFTRGIEDANFFYVCSKKNVACIRPLKFNKWIENWSSKVTKKWKALGHKVARTLDGAGAALDVVLRIWPNEI